MISTLNLMAQGAVTTPAGAVTPVERLYDRQDKAKQELPSAGPAAALGAGLNRLQFTGQWLIDWDLYVDAAAGTEMSLGNWANNWNQGIETNQFQKAQGRPYEERQHILRLRTSAATRMILLPYRKGQRPDPCTVENAGGHDHHQAGDADRVPGGWVGTRRSRGTR